MITLDIILMVFALAFFFARAGQQYDARRAAGRARARDARALLDGELALHAALAVAGDGAEERVLARA